jgi:23S rRNA pseudouridine1911/1915/1917 synthase
LTECDKKKASTEYLKVDERDEGERLDVFLTKCSSVPSRAFAQSLIDKSLVKVDGRKASKHYRLKEGEKVAVVIPPLETAKTAAEPIAVNIVYEDDYLLVLSKPAGMVVHPAPGHKTGTLVNALLFHTKDLSGVGGIERPGIIHRLDKNTSGLMIVAKNDQSHMALSKELKKREIIRGYKALVHGAWEVDSGTIDAPIGRGFKDPKKMAIAGKGSRKAITNFKVLKRFKNYTLLDLRLETGRTHQIRVHMAYAKHPVVGDPEYGLSRHRQGDHSQEDLGVSRQFLHAYRLEFLHPKNGKKLVFEEDLPDDLQEALRLLENRDQICT